MFIISLVSALDSMRASLKYLKTYNVPASRAEVLGDFEEICKAMRVSQSSVIVSLISRFVKDNRKYLSKRNQEKLALEE